MAQRPRVTIDLTNDKLKELQDIAEMAGLTSAMVARAYVEKCLKERLIPDAHVTFTYKKDKKQKVDMKADIKDAKNVNNMVEQSEIAKNDNNVM